MSKKVEYPLKQSIGWHGQYFQRGLQEIPFEMAISMEMLGGLSKSDAKAKVQSLWDEQNPEIAEKSQKDEGSESNESQKDEGGENEGEDSKDDTPNTELDKGADDGSEDEGKQEIDSVDDTDSVDEAGSVEDANSSVPHYSYFKKSGYESIEQIKELSLNEKLTSVDGISETRAQEVNEWLDNSEA